MPKRREGELDDLAPFFRQIYEGAMPLSGRQQATRMSDEQLREILALTYGMVSHLDACVGRVMQALEARGLVENTVVLFLSDHGDMMGDHWLINKGPFHFDGLLKLPFIWRWPGHFASGLATRGLASYLDFAPTILDLARAAIPEGPHPEDPEAKRQLPPWPGHSLVPQLAGEAEQLRQRALVENDEDYLGLRLRTLISDQYKLTAYPGQPFGELFNLDEDPDELHNLWDLVAYRGIKRDLLLELGEELTLTDSPLPRRLCHA